jgi:nucleoside phosphorylase
MEDPPASEDFNIAVICASTIEAHAVLAVFDSIWEDDKIIYKRALSDTNSYTTGRIGHYNVVLAHMPDYSKGNAASVASNVLRSFPDIKIGFIVGVCGGVPNDEEGEDILLGDVIISTGVVEYDLGRQLPNEFIPKNTLGSESNLVLQGFWSQMKGIRERVLLKDNTAKYLAAPSIIAGDSKPKYPGVDEQVIRKRLEQAKETTTAAKEGPSTTQAETEEASEAQKPYIHYGLIASGYTVMKSSEDRDTIATKTKVIAFGMEGARVWEMIPCFIIKGVGDYADRHENKQWQGYAAATAAACMKAFLERWQPTVKQLQHVATPGK